MGRDWNTSYSDAEVLDILWRRAMGQSASQTALVIGATRNAVLGQIYRAEQALRGLDLDLLPDDLLLSLMDDLHGRGVEAARIGKRIGWPRMRVLAVAHAIRLDLARSNAASDAPRASRPGNRNGDLPLGWWAAGVFASPEVA